MCGERELGRHCARYADVLREPEYFPHGGGICGTALVLWNMVTYKTAYWFVNVSPVSWVNLSRVDYDGQLDIPKPYVYFVGTVGFVCGFIGGFVGDAAQAEH